MPYILSFVTSDINFLDDSDIRLKNVNVSDGENAYFDLEKLVGRVYGHGSDPSFFAWKIVEEEWNTESAIEIISKNSESLEYFSNASHKKIFQDIALVNPSEVTQLTKLFLFNNVKDASYVSAVRALHLAYTGEDAGAMEEALNSVRVGQLLQDSENTTLIQYLVGMAIKRFGLETAQKIVSVTNLSGEELSVHIQALNKFYENETGLENVLKAEYYFTSSVIDLFANGDEQIVQKFIGEDDPRILRLFRNSYYFRPNETKLLFAENTRRNIEREQQSCWMRHELPRSEIIDLANPSPIEIYFKENAVGKIVYETYRTSLSTLGASKCEEDMLVAATQAVLAIKAFYSDNNMYPNLLEELVPDYLFSVPVDPFDGKPMKYNLEKKIIYSIGKDLKDSNGSTGDDWQTMLDPTFTLSFH